ncbi:MAG: SusC/RagA family TonB-linked outer membrane protein [Bacteroidota bacterium]
MKRLLLLLAVLGLSIGSALAQSKVSGTVTDASTGDALEGVAVVVKGTTIGAFTDAKGEYTLQVPADASSILFTFVGKKTEEITLSGQSTINIALQEDILQVDEVVVTALGISREKKALGYSVEGVDGDQIVKSGEVNVVQGMAGKVAGLQVIGSGGTPGASSKLLLRGNASITRDNQPLFVIDGVPVSNQTNTTVAGDFPFNANLAGVNNSNRLLDLNPDDIESMTVLKGPAAAALYGSRAGNGAIVITTKRGKRGGGGVRVDFRTSLEFQEVNKLPDLQETYAQGTGGGVRDADGNPVAEGTFSEADPGPDGIWGDGPSDPFTGGDDVSYGVADSWGPTISSLNRDPVNNMEEFFQTGRTFSNNLSLSGGNEKASFRVSIGDTRQEGIVPNTDFRRTSIRVTGESQLGNKFKVFGTANFITSGGTKAQNGSNLSGVMLGLTRAPASFDLAGSGDRGYILPSGNQRQYYIVYDNPYFTVNENPFTDNINRIMGNVALTYNPTTWLRITNRLGTDTYTDQRKQIFAVHAWDPPNPTGQIEENTLTYQEIYNDLIATVDRDLTDDINLSASVGGNLNMVDNKDIYSRGRNLDIPEFYNLGNATDLYTSEARTEVRRSAVFFDVTGSFRDMVYLNVTGRNEWASTYSESAFFPSASLSFVFSELIEQNPIFSFGKLRASYATVGIEPQPYRTRTYFTTPIFTDGFTDGISFPFRGQNGFGISGVLGDPDLQPERVASLEFGADLRFLEGRLTLDVTYYNQRSTDILVNLPIAPSTGYSNIYTNAAEMENRGFEILLGVTPVQTKDFNWTITGNFNRNVNEVLSLPEGVDEVNIEAAFASIGSFAIVGDPYGALYATKWERDGSGNLIINPATGLPLIAAERGNVGNPFPDWLMGINNAFTYKGFTLSALLDIRQGGDIWWGTGARLHRLGRTEESADRNRTYTIDGVLAETDATGAIVFNEGEDGVRTPRATTTANNVEVSALDYYQRFVGDRGAATEQAVYDGSWIRLREVSLGYSKSLPSVPVVDAIDVRFTARNLWLSTDYPGVDPETSLTGAGSNVSGFDYFNMPGTRGYLLSLGLTF